jgi:hypothetical protein
VGAEKQFVSGGLRRQTTDRERCEWIDVLFQACRAVEENETGVLPALRGFDATAVYGIILRLFQSVLREHVLPNSYSRAEKQILALSSCR